MSSGTPSRNADLTFAEVLDQIDAQPHRSPRRRQDLRSAICRFCRLVGREPRDVSADPETVRAHLAQLSATTAGLTPGSWRNLKSLVAQALLAARVISVARRSRIPLGPDWQRLLPQIADRHQRHSLSHFGRYCSARGWSPSDIDDAIMGQYGHDLVSNSLVERPKQAHRTACMIWNTASDTIADWPRRKLEVPYSRRIFALPLSAFAPSFEIDRDAYLAHLAGDDLGSERAAHPASPDTLAARRKQIRAIASALAEAGDDPQSIRSLADLVEPGAAKRALTVLWQRNGRRKSGHLHNLALLLINVARHWVRVDAKHLEELGSLRRRVDPGKTGMTESNRRKLLQFVDPANVAALLRMPQQLAADAVRNDRGGINEAVQMQTAVAIAIELAAPLRIRTLAGLRLDRHIVRSRPGPDGIVHLVIPAEDTKNRVPLELVLPPKSVELIELYRERFLPRFATEPGPWLFPGRHGPKDRAGLSTQISRSIREATGLRMHTHLFRHLAAFLILRRDPGAYETVRLLLGHKSVQTTLQAYCGLEQDAAFRRLDEVLGEYLQSERYDDAAE